MKKKTLIGMAAVVVGTLGLAAGVSFEKKKNVFEDCKRGKRSVLILVNHDMYIYNLRLELIERLLADGYDVHISSPYGERIDDLVKLGVVYHEISFDRHGVNPVAEISILNSYRKLIKSICPIIILGYTIKPNIYGAIASRAYHVPFVANITGLGTAVESGGWKQKLTVLLYKVAFGTKRCRIQKIFFQNEENEQFFRTAGIALDKHAVLPGSGVNLDRYPYREYPDGGDGQDGKPVKFAFISRIMKEKGIEQYLDAAEEIKKRYKNVEFHVCGFCEPEYDGRLQYEDKKGVVKYHGMIRDVAEMMFQMHCIIHPSYHEGMSNVLLEAAATGRPVLASDIPGCRETFDEGTSGFGFTPRDIGSLVQAIERFIQLPYEKKVQMGQAGRRKMEREFDRRIVVEKYMEEIKKL